MPSHINYLLDKMTEVYDLFPTDIYVGAVQANEFRRLVPASSIVEPSSSGQITVDLPIAVAVGMAYLAHIIQHYTHHNPIVAQIDGQDPWQLVDSTVISDIPSGKNYRANITFNLYHPFTVTVFLNEPDSVMRGFDIYLQILGIDDTVYTAQISDNRVSALRLPPRTESMKQLTYGLSNITM